MKGQDKDKISSELEDALAEGVRDIVSNELSGEGVKSFLRRMLLLW